MPRAVACRKPWAGSKSFAWALVLSLPVLLPLSVWLGWRDGITASPQALGRICLCVTVFDVSSDFSFGIRDCAGRHCAGRSGAIVATFHEFGWPRQ